MSIVSITLKISCDDPSCYNLVTLEIPAINNSPSYQSLTIGMSHNLMEIKNEMLFHKYGWRTNITGNRWYCSSCSKNMLAS